MSGVEYVVVRPQSPDQSTERAEIAAQFCWTDGGVR